VGKHPATDPKDPGRPLVLDGEVQPEAGEHEAVDADVEPEARDAVWGSGLGRDVEVEMVLLAAR
jgi:hypothetical protein